MRGMKEADMAGVIIGPVSWDEVRIISVKHFAPSWAHSHCSIAIVIITDLETWGRGRLGGSVG